MIELCKFLYGKSMISVTLPRITHASAESEPRVSAEQRGQIEVVLTAFFWRTSVVLSEVKSRDGRHLFPIS